MKHLYLRESYDTLEAEVIEALKKEIFNSAKESKHMQSKAIKIHNVHNYEEMVIVNERLTFLDEDGLHYNVVGLSLEVLIDILQQL